MKYYPGFPHEPKEGYKWWSRPCYFQSSYPPDTFSWTCAFCSHTEDTRDNYGKVGYECPNCGAVFLANGWQAKEMPEEWVKGRVESWL
jgi:hypothetical protein